MRVKTDVPAPGAENVAGLNAAVVPVGRPEIESVTALLKPALTLVDTVIQPLIACGIVTEAGVVTIVKLGVLAVAEVAENMMVSRASVTRTIADVHVTRQTRRALNECIMKTPFPLNYRIILGIREGSTA